MPIIDQTISTPVVKVGRESRYYCNGGTYFNESTSNESIVSRVFHKSWDRTPNYRALVRARARLPDLGFTFRLHERLGSGFEKTRWNQTQVASCEEVSGWTSRLRFLHNEHISDHVEIYEGVNAFSSASCIATLMERARQAEFNAPVFVAEARRTVDLVLGTARDLATSFRALRRGNLRESFRILGMSPPRGAELRRFNRAYGRDPIRAASNRWLESQYGWVPLLSDAKNAAETLAEMQTLPDRTQGRVTARTRLSRVETVPDLVVMVSPEMRARRVSRTDESWKAVWRFEPLWGLEAIASLGLTNPALVAWELVPLSFVIDWFLPIGRYIEQFDNFVRFKHIGGTLGYRRSVDTTYDGFTMNSWSNEGDVQHVRYITVTRSPFTGVPQLGLESIRWDPQIGAKRLISGLALARQAFR